MKKFIQMINGFFAQFNVNESLPLPDIYAGELNTERIKTYTRLTEQYSIDKSSIRDIFCKGADWYKEKAEQANGNVR